MTAPWPRPPRHPSGRGIDLAVWHAHVERLVKGAYRERGWASSGVEIEDLVSATYERILRCNERSSAYDPSRASMSRYVHILAHSALSNIVRHRNARPPESVGQTQDVALAPLAAVEGSVEEAILDHARDPAHAKALHLMAAGATDAEVLEACGDTPRVQRELAARRRTGRASGGRAPAMGLPCAS